MKLVRWGARGAERPGLIDRAGKLRDLSGVVDDIDGRILGWRSLAALRRLRCDALPVVGGRVRLGAPVGRVGKIVAVGLNYRAHAAGGHELPREPILFLKAPSALAGPNDPLPMPCGATQLDWEVELALVIGRRAHRIGHARALEHVAGYCVANDVSERVFQFQRGPQWDKGKSCDGFCPLGPWLVSREEVPDPQALELRLSVNGLQYQASSTADMLFECAELIAYCSRFMTLEPGDVVLTGTPPGSGFTLDPPRFLAAGDRIGAGIGGLGEQCLRVAPAPANGPAPWRRGAGT